ncbi:MAG: nucleotide exchange factor GrpE, partial [Comamonas sp.]
MSEQPTTPNTTPADASPEEMEAAMAANVADEIARLQSEVSELKSKNTEMADQFLRAKAEAENMRRRAEEEVSKARKFGIESFAESLLPVCDS